MRRRESFDTVAELYDVARPPYPGALVEDLVRTCRLKRGSRVLEIGAGSGQLTARLAALGVDITAVELGPKLARIAGQRLAEYENARVVVADFDLWTPPPGSFDLVVAAMAFHWLEKESRVPKCVQALRRGGRLAVIQNRWGAGGVDDAFTQASRICYERWHPYGDEADRSPRFEEMPDRLEDVTAGGVFRTVERTRYPVERTYTARAYLNLLSSFSNVIGLDSDRRGGFLDCMERLIQARFDGQVTRLDVYGMCIAELS